MALSPIPIISVIVVLFSASSGRGSVAFLVGSVTIIAPVAMYLIRGEKAVATLEDWKIWLTLHNSAVMAVLYLVFSVVLLGQGVSGLATA